MSRRSPLRRVRTHADLLAASGGSPFVRWDLTDPLVAKGYAVSAGDGAQAVGPGSVAFARRTRARGVSLVLLGSAAGVTDLVSRPEVRAWAAGLDAARAVSAPRGADAAVPGALGAGDATQWEWMWTTRALPDVPGQERVQVLDESHREALLAFLGAHNPRTHGQPFARPGQLWVGVRDRRGALVAIGCSEPNPAGAPHLAGITVAPGLRGHGLGAAVTAYLTSEGVGRTGVCTLGMYADNDRARALYHRLGYSTEVVWSTRQLPDHGAAVDAPARSLVPGCPSS
ncbi:MAG TPA: GNAT family N-acetyltransferase [Dermatophilaceae bacterium]|nr:GNAT family N-acetyltransferase [Dermatophilaceae bacterium]